MTATALQTHSLLRLDAAAEVQRITTAVREQVLNQSRRRGVVVGLSGGIDSTVTAALCVKALGPARVFGIFMPEADSSDESLRLGRLLAESLGIRTALEDIRPVLEGAGCYRRRDEAIRAVVPEYGDGWKCKLVLADVASGAKYAISSLVVQSPSGDTRRVRLTADSYLQIVAATNFKQRTRKMLEYYHADRLNFVVAGTPNRLEYDQGFFVKNGDGAADIKPIAHLYKTQVYQLGEYLGVPGEILSRPSTTDTFSLPQSQEEFYFAVSLDKMDLCLYGKNHGMAAAELAAIAGMEARQVQAVYDSIDAKRRATQYLQNAPLLVDAVAEIRHYPGGN
ncbi:MAG TPA: NAD(+) synthase [Clostridia bacterium]|nr:NAD(+) synthase [Clostridia bacterium]